jgi:hypothetical protein
MSEFKNGDMIEVRNHNANQWNQEELIAITKDNKYLCWNDYRTDVFEWNFGRPIDKFRKLKECYKLGAILQVKIANGKWSLLNGEPSWDNSIEYRIKDGIEPKQFLKHYKEIIAFWNGESIEYYNEFLGDWVPKTDPSWYINDKYRVKEKPIYYYQWEKLSNDYECISLSSYITDECAAKNHYVEDRWRKIESSRRIWEE